jgi:hypothetical protein
VRIEHIGFLVERPISMAKWWVENLDFEVLRQSGDDGYGVSFLRDDNGTILEFGNVPTERPLDFHALAPLQVHIAIDCEDTVKEAERLISKGAVLLGESPLNEFKHERLLLRDPFGAVIQLVNRAQRL